MGMSSVPVCSQELEELQHVKHLVEQHGRTSPWLRPDGVHLCVLLTVLTRCLPGPSYCGDLLPSPPYSPPLCASPASRVMHLLQLEALSHGCAEQRSVLT